MSGNYSLDGIGGIIGTLWSSNVKNCYNTGTIKGMNRIGGIIGNSTNNSLVANCYNLTPNILGNLGVGNLIGTSTSTTGRNLGWVSGKTPIGQDSGGSWSSYAEYTQTQMHDQNELLNLLNTGDGAGLWNKASIFNNGYPYLVNKP